MDDSLITLLERATVAVEPLVGSVTVADEHGATPCPDLDLAHLVAHLIGGLAGFADVADGKELRFDAEPELPAGAAAPAFRAAADRLLTGFSRPGLIERTFAMPWGPTAGAQLLGFELIELLVHGWDIARALGREAHFDDDLVTATLAGARQWVDDSARIPVLFGPEVVVAADAPVLDQLVAFLGRRPAWAPPAAGAA